METEVKLFLERAENELVLSETLLKISLDKKIQVEIFEIKNEMTFYSSVISHAYYCIFYSAKAYLISKSIRTEIPNEHNKTYQEFKKFVADGSLNKELLDIYEIEISKAETLLKIFEEEKLKRGKFTYQIMPQANIGPAKESIDNANKFFKAINNVLK